MKKLLAALAAAIALTATGAASAQDYGRNDRGEWRGDRDGRDSRSGRGDWNGRGRDGDVITIRDHGRVYAFDENDRMFYRLLESPFGMRPGNTYVYTDECRRDQCQVIIYSRARRDSAGRLWAPPISRWRNDQRYDGRYDDDRRYRDDAPFSGGRNRDYNHN